MKKTIYLYKSGTLSRKDNSLVLIKNNSIDYIPIEQIDLIICFSEITLNKRVLALLNINKVVLLFYNFYGNYIGRFTPKKYSDGKILLNQVNAYNDIDKRLYIAKQIMISSSRNMLAFLKYYNKKDFNFEFKIEMIESTINELKKSNKIDSLMLIEAKIKQIYYSSFDIILKNSEFKFNKRTIRPPKNEVNAMMSYGYSILYGHYLSVLDRSSLNPQISFVHSLSKSTDALQYDLADILKPVIVDRLIIRLIRKRQIKKEYFDYSKDRCFLNKEGALFFVEEFDKQLKNCVFLNNKSYSYKSLISREVHILSNYLKGKSKSYKPYIMSW